MELTEVYSNKILSFDSDIKEEEKPKFPTIIDIYKQSIITAEKYFDDCIILSAKTSNNMEVIENLSYWKFKNLLKSLNKYINAENNQNQEESGENIIDKQKKEFNSSMSSMKNKFKPKIK